MIASVQARVLPGWADPERVFTTLFGAQQWAYWLDPGPDAVRGRTLMGAATRVVAGDLATLPFAESAVDDALGWYGWIEYEAGAAALGVSGSRSAAHGVVLLRGERVVEFDHATRCIRLIALADDGAERWLDDTAAVIAALPTEPSDHVSPAPASVARWRHDEADYAKLVRRCQARIRAGDAYQLCLTNEVTVAGRFDPLERYRALRRISPSHHGALIRAGERSLLSASPEVFLEMRGGRVATHPIKGTRPRGADAEADAALRAELLGSVKERAENLMIVDLMRNDLSRVAQLGTVAAERLLEVESYPQVHQLVSTVSARLREGVGVADVVAATFPAGSMTGAPKRRAMQILADLEGGPRGAYAGAFGRIGFDGSADLAMTIRTIVLDAAGARIGTGGGITILSDPAEEVEETRVKARAPLQVLGVS